MWDLKVVIGNLVFMFFKNTRFSPDEVISLRDAYEIVTTDAECAKTGLEEKMGQLKVVIRSPDEEYRYTKERVPRSKYL